MLKNILAAAVAATSLFLGSTSLQAATIDLGFAIDESGSVNSSDFRLAKNGLANALGQIPTSGDNVYRISVVSFDNLTRTIVPVTEVTAASLATIQSSIRGISQRGGATAIGSAIALLTTNFTTAGLGDTTLFNVTTDGSNNRGVSPTTAASDAAAAGVDGLSFEAVGAGANTAALLDIAFPGTPLFVSDADDLPNPTTTSFVFAVNSFADYEAAITSKVNRIVVDTGGGTDPTSPIPLPAGMPLILAAMAGLGGLRMMRKTA